MAVTTFRSLLEAEIGQAGIHLDPECLARLERHYDLLRKWNRAVRLIGDVEPRSIVRRHVLESLALVPLIREASGSLLDIGSGNGFPAIPLKCALPQMRLVMLEPTVRKSVFLDTVSADLGLSDTTVVRDRIDRPSDLARLGRWDSVTMRAVAIIPAVLEGAPRALRREGRVLFMVGEAGRAEIRRRLVGPLELVDEKLLPGSRGSWVVAVGRSERTDAGTIH